MATLSNSEARRRYSWWWDSHIPKNSKWLHDNLTDMDVKVKQMIKLIEEDADSFARRAEMYYKKRPELMKLVEEFYRAYRALAERYDHATVELRQAHRTMSQAFPNQVPYILDDDSPYTSSGRDTEPHTLVAPLKDHGFHDSEELHKNRAMMKDGRKWTSWRSLKQFQEMLESGEDILNGQLESANDGDAEMEVQTLKNTLAKIEAEKEAVLSQYTETLEKLSDLEKELHSAKNNSRGLDEQASRAETEIKALKEALEKLKAERDAALHKYSQCMERVYSLQNMVSEFQMDAKGLNERATKAETEAQNYKEELFKMEAEKEATLFKYNQCLNKISALENKILFVEKEARKIKDQIKSKEREVTELKQAVSRLTNEKETVALQYKKCLETIAELAAEISCAHEEAKQLRSEIQNGAAKLIGAEEQCISLERSNHSLQEEADILAHKIENKDQELSKKQEKLEKLQALLQDEHSSFIQVEVTLHNLQQLHSQSQEAQRELALELKDVLQLLKDLEACRYSLEEEMQRVKDENQRLTKQNLSSTFSLDNLQNEISHLKALKEKLEQELVVQAAHTNALQQEISRLKEEIEGLNMRYQILMQQVESAGLKPEYIASSLKELQDEKIQLKDLCEKEIQEKEDLAEQLKNMDKVLEKNAVMESSLSELKNMLQGSREKIKELQDSSQMLQGEKSNLVSEKAALLSQLNIMTETMQMLLEKNTMLEKSLSGANIELEGLRTKSKSLEEYCQLLSNEKSSLLTERSILVSQLDSVEQRFRSLEMRFTKLEEKYDGLEKEKQSTLCQFEELRGSISVEKEKRAKYVQSTDTRMTSLESIIQILEEQKRWRKNEEDQELDKAVKAQVEIFILQKFIKDLEEKNLSLLIECQKNIEASKMSDKLISELEGENLEQQVEAEFLLDEIEKLRKGIQQVFTALQINQVTLYDNFLAEEMPIPNILSNIEGLKSSFVRSKDEKHQLLIENSVLSSSLKQLRMDNADLESEKQVLEKELKIMTEQQGILQKDKHHLMETNSQLILDVNRGEQQEVALKNEIENLDVKLVNLQQSYLEVQEDSCKKLEENRSLVKKLSEVNQTKCVLQEEISEIAEQALYLSNLSMVLEIYGTEKAAEIKALTEDHHSLQTINDDLINELKNLEEKMKMKEEENLHLKNSVESFEKKLHEISDINGQLNIQFTVAEDFVRQKEYELSEAKQKLDKTQQLNLELSKDVEELRRRYEESKLIEEDLEKIILVTFKDNSVKTLEIEGLHEQNESLESKVGRLEKEIEKHRMREENLCLELLEKQNEFEVWNAEATSFYFDLHVSSVREAILENKLYELNGIYRILKDENCNKNLEIEQMKGRITSLESELGGMTAQMSAYNSAIDSLSEDVALLDNNALHLTKLKLTGNNSQEDPEATAPVKLKLQQDQSVLPDRISDLLQVQTRIRAVGKAMMDEMARVAKHDSRSSAFKQKTVMERSGELQSQRRAHQDAHQEERGVVHRVSGNIKLQKTKPELLEVRNGTLMKDIPLDQVSHGSYHSLSRRRHGRIDDQMLQLWETVEQDPMIDKSRNQESIPTRGNDSHRLKDSRHQSRVPSLEMLVEKELSVDKQELSSKAREPIKEGKRKILERLASDAQKITNLQTSINELRKRMDMLKRSKKAKNVEYETVRTQFQEIEETVVQLTSINDELTKNLDGSPLSWEGRTPEDFEEARSVRRRRAAEQARKESEKIGRLQIDIQNIQYVLLKLEDENKSKGNNKISESTTGILLKDFIYNGKTGSRRRKKVRFCGCMRSSSTKKILK